MEWLNFRHLYAFWAVCRYGGFQKAAKQLFVSQSAISEQVSQLEQYLEEHLLERNTRKVSVTARGAALLEYADAIFSKSKEINHIFHDKNESLVPSEIRIGMVGGISRNLVFALVFRNLMEERGTKIDIIDGSFDELSEMVKDFQVDLVFTLEKPKKKDLLGLSFKRVESSPLCIAATPDLIRQIRRRRSTQTDLEVYMFNHHFEKDPLETSFETRYQVATRTVLTTDDISLLRFLANSGRGAALLPEIGIHEDLTAGRLSRIRLDDVPPVEFYAIFLKSGFHRELIDDFLS